MSGIVIRRFETAHQPRWRELWQGYNTFYKRSVEDRVTDRLWTRLMEGTGEPFGFGAELDGQLVGLAHYFFLPSTSDWNPRCYLQDLFADPAVRGRGVGGALMDAVFAEANRREASQTYWLTQEFNHTARKLYDRVGQATPFIKYQRI